MDRRNPSRRSKDKAYEGLSQQSSTSGSSSRSAAKNEDGNQSPSSSFLIQNSRKSKRWPCEVCTLLNSSRRKKCEVCGAARPINANLDSSSEKAQNRKSTGKKRQRPENNESNEEKSKSNSLSQSNCPKISTWVKGRRSKRKRPPSISDNQLESEEVINQSHDHESRKNDSRNIRVSRVRLRLENEVQSGQMEALLLHSLQHCIISNDEYFSNEDKKATAITECIEKCDSPKGDQMMETLTDLKTHGESDDHHSTEEYSTGIQSDNSTKERNQVLSMTAGDFVTNEENGRKEDIALNDHSSVGDISLSHELQDEPFKTAISSEHDVVFNTNEKTSTKQRECTKSLTDLNENASSIENIELEKNLPNTAFHAKGSQEYGDVKQSIEGMDSSIEDGSVTQLMNSQMTLDSPDSSDERHVQTPQFSSRNPDSPVSPNTISKTQKLDHTCSSFSDLYTQPPSARKKDYIDDGQSRRFLSMTQNFSQNFEYGECKKQLDALTGTTSNISQAHVESVDTNETTPTNSLEFTNGAKASTLSFNEKEKTPEASLSSTINQHQSSEDILQNEMQEDLLKAADLLYDEDKIQNESTTNFGKNETINPASKTMIDYNQTQTTMSACFTSAGGSAIKISEEARAKAADLFKDSDNINNTRSLSKLSTLSAGFTSAGGSTIKISEEGRAKAADLFKDSDNQNDNMNNARSLSKPSSLSACFTSAGGSAIKISEEARAKAADLFKDSDNINNTRSLSKPSSLSVGFTSAGGSTIKISEEARAKAADLFKDSDNQNDNINKTRSLSKPSTLSVGFTSAGGSTIKISEEARAKAADLFKDSDNINNTRSLSKLSTLSAGFTSAGGSTIKISEEGRAKAADLFKDSDNQNDNMNNARSLSKPSSLSACFTSAGGSAIKISEEARAKAADLFKDSDNINNTRSLSKPSSLSVGFTSAGGSTIKISEEARAKAADLFKDSDNQNDNINKTRSLSKPSTLSVGFTSAGGSAIKISEEARAKAADLFKDSDKSRNTRDSMSAGFISAGGSTIKISEKARAKAADLFKDSDNKNKARSLSTLSAGFTSAGGSTIKVSEEARAKAADLFKDSDNINNTRSLSKLSTLSAGFISAGGSTIKISEEGRAKAADLFKDSDNQNDNMNKTRSLSKPSTLSVGFTSAGGSTIKISEEARAKAADLFKDSDNINNTRSLSKLSTLSAGFTSAGGSTIKISEEGRAKAADLFKDSDNQNDNMNNARSLSKPSSLSACFTSAGGSAIKISEEARAKAADLFKDSDNINNTRSLSKPSSLSVGFTSAGGSTIKISEEARAKAADLFKDSDNQNDNINKTRSLSKPSTLSVGFTSAGGSAIKISEEARAKAADLFKDSDKSRNTRDSMSAGFISAGGSTIKISEKARAKAADLFKDSDNKNKARSLSTLSAGFTSAGGSTIKVSEEARAKAADLFKDSDNINNTRSLSKLSTLSAGFISAGGSTIKISEEGRAKAADLFKDSDNQNDNMNNARSLSKPSSLSVGFTSAGGSAIKISEEARAKAADLFKDSDNQNDNINKTRSLSKPSTLSAGFTSAGGSAIKISEEARAKAADLFKDSDKSRNTRDSMSAGFISAGGSTIKISEKARAKAADLFKDSDNKNKARSLSTLSAGFTSAGGSTIKVSEEARAKAADLFKDSDNINNTRSLSKLSTLSAGFISAGGSTIKISEEARAKAADLFKDSDNQNDNINKTRSLSKPSTLSAGFTSAGGSAIKISEEARAKAADLFKDSDNQNDNINNARSLSKPSTLSVGFTSAGGSAIKISEEARAKAADLFKDSDNQNDNINNARSLSKPSTLSAGFTSAGGSAIKVSEEARAKAADLFKDSDNHNDQSFATVPAGFTSAGGSANLTSEQESPLQNDCTSCDEVVCTEETCADSDWPSRRSSDVTEEVEYDVSKVLNFTINSSQISSSDLLAGSTSSSAKNNLVENSKKGYTSHDQYQCLPTYDSSPEHNTAPLSTFSNEVTKNNQYLLESARKKSVQRKTENSTSKVITLTPHQTPMLKHNIVTRSVENENIRPFHSKQKTDPVTPIPFNGFTETYQEIHEPSLQLRFDFAQHDLSKNDSKTITLDDLSKRYGQLDTTKKECVQKGVSEMICRVDPENSSRLRFDCFGNPIGFVGERDLSGIRVIGSVDDLRIKLITCGCKASLLDNNWIANHYRWIVWKLASLERRFASLLARKYLTYDHVILQLRKRFKREIDTAERPLLRKILNRDIAASSPMVVCISKIIEDVKTKSVKLHVTDGWYEVPALIDESLQDFVKSKKLFVGSKIIACGASIEGAEEGIDPLDKYYPTAVRLFSVRLKLFANGTRICKWSTKLGYVKFTKSMFDQGGAFLTKSLDDVIEGGGSIPCIDLVVCRRYPLLYMEEQHVHGENRKRVLTESENSAYQRSYEEERSKKAATLAETLKKEFLSEIDEDAPQIWKDMQLSSCTTTFFSTLDSNDQDKLRDWEMKRGNLLHQRTQKEVMKELNESPSRSSRPFLRVLVASCPHKNMRKNDNFGIMTIWSPSEDQLNLMEEGTMIRCINLGVQSISDGKIQLSVNRNTTVRSLPDDTNEELLQESGYNPRRYDHLMMAEVASKCIFKNPRMVLNIDICGCLLKVVEIGSFIYMYLIDESKSVLRVEREIRDDCISSLRHWKDEILSLPRGSSLFLQDVQMVAFDLWEECSVAIWSEYTVQREDEVRMVELEDWFTQGGEAYASLVCAKVSCGILTHFPEDRKAAIGTLHSFELVELCNSVTENETLRLRDFVWGIAMKTVKGMVQVAVLPTHHIPFLEVYNSQLIQILDEKFTVDEMKSIIDYINAQFERDANIYHTLLELETDEMISVTRISQAELAKLYMNSSTFK